MVAMERALKQQARDDLDMEDEWMETEGKIRLIDNRGGQEGGHSFVTRISSTVKLKLNTLKRVLSKVKGLRMFKS